MSDSAPDLDRASEGSHESASSFWRFPYRRIAGNSSFEDWFARFVWMAIPLEYYVLTHTSGGAESGDFLLAVLVALTSVLLVLAIGSFVAIFPLGNISYATRVRIWAASLVVSWSVSLLFLALSIFVTRSVDPSGYDLLGQFLCQLSCGNYPSSSVSLGGLYTFASHVAYATAAAAVMFLLAHRFGKPTPKVVPASPNVIAIILLTAVILTLMQGLPKIT